MVSGQGKYSYLTSWLCELDGTSVAIAENTLCPFLAPWYLLFLHNPQSGYLFLKAIYYQVKFVHEFESAAVFFGKDPHCAQTAVAKELRTWKKQAFYCEDW